MYSDLNLKKPSTRNGLCSRIDTRIDTNGLEQLQTSNSTELFSELFTLKFINFMGNPSNIHMLLCYIEFSETHVFNNLR